MTIEVTALPMVLPHQVLLLLMVLMMIDNDVHCDDYDSMTLTMLKKWCCWWNVQMIQDVMIVDGLIDVVM